MQQGTKKQRTGSKCCEYCGQDMTGATESFISHVAGTDKRREFCSRVCGRIYAAACKPQAGNT